MNVTGWQNPTSDSQLSLPKVYASLPLSPVRHYAENELQFCCEVSTFLCTALLNVTDRPALEEETPEERRSTDGT